MTIRELLDGITMELQGNVVVRRWNEQKGRFEINLDLFKLSSKDSVFDKQITFMYAAPNPNDEGSSPVLIIEISTDEE